MLYAFVIALLSVFLLVSVNKKIKFGFFFFKGSLFRGNKRV